MKHIVKKSLILFVVFLSTELYSQDKRDSISVRKNQTEKPFDFNLLSIPDQIGFG